MTTDKREATCPKCGGVHYGTGPGCVYDKEWPKPPATEKAEWERVIVSIHDRLHQIQVSLKDPEMDAQLVNSHAAVDRAIAAVQRAIQDAYGDGIEQGIKTHEVNTQRALDEREAATWTRAAGSVSDTMNTGKDTMLDAAAFMDFANEKAAAAEARARRDDGESAD